MIDSPIRRRRRPRKLDTLPPIESTEIPVEPIAEQTEPTKVRRKRGPNKKKSDDAQPTRDMFRSLRAAMAVVTNGHPLVPTQEEEPLIIDPIANLVHRHSPIPTTDNPDLQDGLTLAVGLLGPYRNRVRHQMAERRKAKAEQVPQEPEPVPFYGTPETSYETYQPQADTSMADIARNGHSEYSQPPITAPYMSVSDE